MDNSNRTAQYHRLLAQLAYANLELKPDEYKVIKEQPFRAWPKALQDKLRPFGAEAIK